MKTIYLDHAAATPLCDEALRAMRPYWTEKFHNPSATYLAGRDIRDDIERNRARVARWLGSRPSEIIFTAGGTEANNLAIRGVMERFPEGNLAVSAIEHESVLAPARDYQSSEVTVKLDGRIDIDDLAQSVNDQTVLVSVMYANNEIGTIQPLRQVARVINEARQSRLASGNPLPLYLHADACQAPNYLDLHVSSLGVDLMTLNAGKIYGPKQCGALFARRGVALSPLIKGGGQERGLRSGTESAANIAGLAAALDQAQASRLKESERLAQLQRHFIELLRKELPAAKINGSVRNRLPNNLHITIAGRDNERLMMALDERGIQCAVGSACSASRDEPSHVLSAIGLTDQEARASLRFTMGRATRQADVNQTVQVLKAIIQA